MPGVQSVVVTDSVPLSMGSRSDGYRRKDEPKAEPMNTELYMVTPGYFETMGIHRLAGRGFEHEGMTAPKVAVVNETFVRKVFKGSSPLNQMVVGPETYQIIGVVKDTKSRTVGEANRPVLYRLLGQNMAGDQSIFGYTLIVRSAGDVGLLEGAIRHEAASLDPALAVFNVSTMQQHLQDALFLPRLAGTLFGIFGVGGLLLTAVGLYGVINYSVTRRTREIGIRMALGAERANVQRLIVRQGMALTLIALVIGLPIALMGARFLSSFLYGVRANDSTTFVLVPLFVALVASLACYLPARRASRVMPQIALRHE